LFIGVVEADTLTEVFIVLGGERVGVTGNRIKKRSRRRDIFRRRRGTRSRSSSSRRGTRSSSNTSSSRRS